LLWQATCGLLLLASHWGRTHGLRRGSLSGNRKDGLNNRDPLPFYLVLAFQALLIMLVVILVVIIKLA
jgi:hypothetical protein